MSLLTSSIDLDTISPPTAEISQFNSSQIENLANLFLQAGDTVRPILLRKISPISFQILEGHFEYYAAMKAQEIDDQFTAIRAYVVPPDLESTILAQYQFLRSLSSSTPVENIAPPPPQVSAQSPNLAQIEQAISDRLEQKLAITIDRIVEERISASFQVFATQMTQQLDTHLLDFRRSLLSTPINKIVEPTIQPIELEPIPQKASKVEKPSKTKTDRFSKTKNKNGEDNDPKRLQVLNDLNTMNFADLERKLAQSKNGKFARSIHEQRSEQKFQSIKDVIANIQGLAEKTMQKIIDAW